MPRVSTDYMNARKDLGADKRKGRTIFSAPSRDVDIRAQEAAAPDLEQAERAFASALMDADLADIGFRHWFATLPSVAELLGHDTAAPAVCGVIEEVPF